MSDCFEDTPGMLDVFDMECKVLLKSSFRGVDVSQSLSGKPAYRRGLREAPSPALVILYAYCRARSDPADLMRRAQCTCAHPHKACDKTHDQHDVLFSGDSTIEV